MAKMRLRLPALLQRTMTRASTAMAASSWSLCVDFDDTCSVRDTTADLARLACTGNHPQTSEVWDSLVARFLEDCASVMSTLGDDLDQKSLTFQPQMLDAFLAAYSAVDLRSVDRVMASRVLAGIPRSSIVNRVALKPDCAHVLSTWPGDVTVVSSNWSRTSVLSALTDVARARHRAGLPFAVHANELEFDHTEVSTGNILLPFQAPHHKAQYIQTHRDDHQSSCSYIPVSGLAHPSSHGVVFVGDGINDLPALLAADVGIVLNARGSSIFKLAAHVGLTIADATTLQLPYPSSPRTQPTLYHATSWKAVHTLLCDTVHERVRAALGCGNSA